MKDSIDFIPKTEDILVDDHDILVNFDIISLITKIMVPQAINLIFELVDSETLNLLKKCLSSTFFSFKGIIYDQTKGTEMGSSLSLVVT